MIARGDYLRQVEQVELDDVLSRPTIGRRSSSSASPAVLMRTVAR
jgi:hypothetical protein